MCLPLQMRVMLNASALSGVIIFALFNTFGMNLGNAPDRLAGVHGFAGSSFMGAPLFDMVRSQTPDLIQHPAGQPSVSCTAGCCMQVTILIVALAVLVYFAFLVYLHYANLGPFNIAR